jgi:hypothetical protein
VRRERKRVLKGKTEIGKGRRCERERERKRKRERERERRDGKIEM